MGRFAQADSIIPGAGNSSAWDRYAYTLNNPLRYTDPSGHIPFVTPRTTCDLDCWRAQNQDDGDDDDGECSTVACNAFEGDVGAIIDLLVPTNFGWRFQIEVSASLPNGWGVTVTPGLNLVFNRVSRELGASFDVSGEPGFGISPTIVGGSGTTGPILGWVSSTVTDVVQGDSYVVSGTASYEAAISGAVSVPREGNSLYLHVDPVYGQVPFTFYGGAGGGSPYGGVGVGPSHVFANVIINLSPYLPWK